ncbi:MAG: glutathione binding-like protein, partial [Arenicellales bacterium]|nr:glutathione binding-like protein [Arenicellales bacterium]
MPKVDNCMKVLAGLHDDCKFLASDTMTLADIHFVPIYDYFQNTPESKPILDQNPGLRTWWDVVGERESVVKTQPALG